ncbi:hypothetical protein LCGC14_2946220, partial [marine sediment metagenome]
TIHPGAQVVRVALGKATLAIAFDAAKGDAPDFDRVRLDFTGRGNFANARVVRRYMKVAHQRTGKLDYCFRERPMTITVGGRKMVVEFICTYTETRRPGGKPAQSVRLSIATAVQGNCRFGDVVRNVRVIDANNNLTLTDVGAPAWSRDLQNARGDRLRVDFGSGDFKYSLRGLYGSPVLVAGRLYDIVVSDDGARIDAKPYTGKIGYVRIDHPAWQASFFGPRSVIPAEGGPKPVPIPVGQYQMASYREWICPQRTNCSRRLFLADSPSPPTVTIAEGKTADLRIGAPVTGRVRGIQAGRVVLFKPLARAMASAVAKPMPRTSRARR